MAFRVKPDMSAVWASLGDNTKPVDSYITNGWEAVKPPRQYFNWLDNRQDSAIAYIYQAGIVEWDDLTDYEGGAGENSYVQGSDGKVYKCLADNGPNVSGVGTKDPVVQPGNAAFWVEAFGSKAASDQNATDIADLRADYEVGAAITDPAAFRTAISALAASDFTGSARDVAGTDGYQELPGGVVLMWGSVIVPVDTSATVTLPIPVTVLFAVTGSTYGNLAAGGTNVPGFQADNYTTTDFRVTNDGGATEKRWIAIGLI